MFRCHLCRCVKDKEMDGKCFVKLMKDSKMIGSRFTTTDPVSGRLVGDVERCI